MALALIGCASAPPETPSRDPVAAAFASALVGRWDNAAQWDRAPEDLRRPPAAGHPYDWIDHQSAAFYRVEAPLIGDQVIYLEWRSGGPEGPISRQRLWSFRIDEAGAPRMDFFTFIEPTPYAGRGSDADAFEAIQPSDLIGYGETCALVVTPSSASEFTAAIPETCVITARSGRRMRLDAVVTLAGRLLTYREQGVLDDGTVAFKVPGGPPYLFERLP